jgi:hypothetical protein
VSDHFSYNFTLSSLVVSFVAKSVLFTCLVSLKVQLECESKSGSTTIRNMIEMLLLLTTQLHTSTSTADAWSKQNILSLLRNSLSIHAMFDVELSTTTCALMCTMERCRKNVVVTIHDISVNISI